MQHLVKEAQILGQKSGDEKLEIHPGEMKRNIMAFCSKKQGTITRWNTGQEGMGASEHIHKGFFITPALMKRKLKWWRRQSGESQVIKQMKKLWKDWHMVGLLPRLQQMRYFWALGSRFRGFYRWQRQSKDVSLRDEIKGKCSIPSASLKSRSRSRLCLHRITPNKEAYKTVFGLRQGGWDESEGSEGCQTVITNANKQTRVQPGGLS